jgi:hypothetical protein
MRLASYLDVPVPVLMSATLAPGTVIAVALSALASAVEPVVVEAGTMPSVQFDDTNPQPPTASPTMSQWQADAVGLWVRLPATWVIRNAQAVAVTTLTKW